MPNSIDNRVVEMRFDNAQFEKNIHQSIRSLQQLDNSLDMSDSVKSFEKLENTVNNADFSKMEKSLAFIEYRLSAVGMTSAKIINGITDKIGGMFSKLNAMTLGQIKSGGMARALKLEHANFMLDGILNDAKKVKDIMDNAVSPAVDGTAYGLDAAANAASQFVASGITDIEKLKTALTGISGVAAMSGSEYEDIARIFTKVAASGRMMGDEVLQLSTRGINAQAELAEYLDVSIDKVQEMQKKGQISFEIFSEAMNKAFGAQAKKANDTYTGALSNLKAALSRIGADFATPYLNNMRDIFNALRVSINTAKKSLQPLVELYSDAFVKLKDFTVGLLENEHFINIYQNGINGLVLGVRLLSKLFEPLRRGFQNAFPEGMVGILEHVTTKITDFLYKLEFSQGFLNDIGDFLGGIFSILKLVGFAIEKITGVSAPLFQGVNSVIGLIGKLLGLLGRLITYTSNWIMGNRQIVNILNAVGSAIRLAVALVITLGAGIVNFIASAKDLPIVKECFEGITTAAKNLANFVLPKLATVANVVANAFGVIFSIGKSGATSAFNFFKESLDKITHSMQSSKSVMDTFGNIFGTVFRNLPGTLHASAKGIDDLNSAVVTTVGDKGMFGILYNIVTVLGNVTSMISGGLSKGLSKVLDIVNQNLKAFGYGRAIIVGLGAGMVSTLFKISGAVKSFKKAFDGIPGLIGAATQALKAPLFNAKATAMIIGLAVAIGALTISLIALSQMKPENLKAAAIAILSLIGAMTIAGVLMNKLGGGLAGFQATAISFMSFSIAITSLCGALKILSMIDIDFKALMGRVLALAAIMAEMYAMIWLMQKVSSSWSLLLGGGFLIAMGTSMLLLVKALNSLCDIPYAKLQQVLPMLLKMMTTLALVAACCSLLMPFAGISFITIMGGILAFTAGMTLLANTMDASAFARFQAIVEEIYNAVKGLLIFFSIAATIVLVTIAVKKTLEAIKLFRTMTGAMVAPATKAAEALKTLAKGAVIATIVGGFIAIAVTIAKLGDLPSETFNTGCVRALEIAAGFLVFLGLLSALDVAAKRFGGGGEFLGGLDKMIASVAAILLSMALSLKIVSSIPPDQIATAERTIIMMLGAVVIFETMSALLASGKQGIEMGIKTAVALSVLISALTLCIGLLSLVAQEGGWVNLAAATAGMLAVMLGVAAICFTMGKIKFGQALGAAIAMAAVIGAIGYCMYQLKDADWKNLAYNMGTLLVATLAMALVMKAVSSMDNAVKGVAGMLGIAVIFGAMSAVAIIIQNVNWENFAANMGVILIAVTAMAGLLYIIGGNDVWKNVAIGVAAMAGISLLFGVLTGVAMILQAADWKSMLANFAIIEGAVAVMAGILYIIGSDAVWGKVAIGLAAAAGIAVLLGLLSGVGLIVQTLNWQSLLANLAIIEGAVALMAGILYVIGQPTIAAFCLIGEVIVALMTVIFLGLAGVAVIINSINPGTLLQNLAILEGAVAVMAVIMGIIGVPAIAAFVALGAVVVGLMTVIFLALAGVALIIQQINPQAFMTNIGCMAIAVAGLAVIMGALGAICMTGVGAAALLAGATALLMFAGVMAVFAGVSYLFAKAGEEVAAALMLLSPALQTAGIALEDFSHHDFDGIIGNLVALAGAIVVLGNLSGETERAASSMASLGAAITSVHENVGNLNTDVSSVATSADTLLSSVNKITEAVSGLATAAKDAAHNLASKELASVISAFAEQFKSYSGSEMQDVGIKMVQDICAGCKSEIVNSIAPLVADMVAGLRTEVTNQKTEINNIGAEIGAELVAGTRGPNGVDAHSPAEEFVKIAKDCIAGITKHFTGEGKTQAKKDGEGLGQTITNATGEGFLNGMPDLVGDMKAGLGSALTEAQNFLNKNPLEILVNTSAFSMDGGSRKDALVRLNDGRMVSNKWINEQRRLGDQKTREKLKEATAASTSAINSETSALNSNSGAVGKNSAAKKKNEKANDGKTKAIDEETQSLGEEAEQTNETSEAIREMAEQIEVTTEKYNELNHYIGLSTKTTGRLRRYQINSGKIWSGTYDSIGQITAKMKELVASIPSTVATSKRGLYTFSETMRKASRLYRDTDNRLIKSTKSIKRYVETTGKEAAKVYGDTVKVFYKEGGKVNKLVMNASKNVKSTLPKAFKAAYNTAKKFSGDLNKLFESYEWSDNVIADLRQIEKSFGKVKFGSLTEGVQKYLHGIRDRFKELDPAIRQISRSLGGTYNVFSKVNRVVPATMDALVSLGAVLYNGSDAANEYATKIAQLEFLAEHGEATWEEVEEAKIAYLTRIKDALLEYKKTLEDVYGSEIDMFKEFEKNELPDGTNILKTQASNIAGYFTYGEMLTELSRRIPNLAEGTQLVKQFAEGGIENFGKLKAVLQLNNQELQAFVYGIGILNKTQEELSNKAFAAVANATSYASKRQQAKTKDIATKTTKYSAKLRKAIESDMQAVAQAQQEYNILTKKQEKEYLKTLTKREKAQYKKYKNDVKYAKKAYNAQRKLLESEEKVTAIMKGITDYKTYLEALGKYATDMESMKIISEKFTKAFEPLSDVASGITNEFGSANDALLSFANTLDATGEDGLNFFEEMAKRIENFREGVRKSISDINILSEAFGKSTEKVTLKDIYEKNILSQISGHSEIADDLTKLMAKGYNHGVINMIKQMWDSDPAKAKAHMEAMLTANQDYINKINASYEVQQQVAKDTANLWLQAMSNASNLTKEERRTIIDNKIKSDLNPLINARKALETEYANKFNEIQQTQALINRLTDAQAQLNLLDKKKKRTKSEEKQYQALMKMIYKDNKLVSALKIDLSTLNWELSQIDKKRADALAKEQAKAAEIAKAEQALLEYNVKMEKYINEVRSDAAMKSWWDSNITSVKTMIDTFNRYNKSYKQYQMISAAIATIKAPFSGYGKAEWIYNLSDAFTNIKAKASDMFINSNIDNFTDGLLRFGQTLVDAKDDVEDFYEALKTGLDEYQKSLKSTIASSSNFFSMFKGFSDEDNPLTANDYLEYADSQIEALKTWQANLMKLTDKGLNKELVEQFASQGLSSYEQVAAWAEATADQIASYNYQWQEYQNQVESASQSAMASIAAAWSTAGTAISDKLISYFKSEGASKLQEAGEDASGMLIEGIKDGLTNAMPQIVDTLTTSDSVSAIASKIGNTVGSALNQGMVQSIANSVSAAVKSAIDQFKMAVDTINEYIDTTLNTEFTFTVHVNVSEIDDAVARMNEAIYGINANAISTQQAVVSSIANSNTNANTATQQPTSNVVNNFNYTQNNNSPKALSRSEIYRQTQNQLSTIEGAISSAMG